MKTLTLSFTLSFLLLTIYVNLVFLSFHSGSYLVSGNIHDIFIPLNSAYAVDQGLSLHEEFHSPFGILYHALNFASYSLTKFFSNLLHPLDTIFLTSAIFAAYFSAIFLAVRWTLPTSKKPTLWVYLVLFTLIFQVRDVNSWSPDVPYWYGIYNHQLWALLLLQLVHCFYWKRIENSTWSTATFAIIQSLFLVVMLNYKLNFFAGSGLICIAAMFKMDPRQIPVYIFSGFATVSIAIVAFMQVGGYSYVGYLQDIGQAVDARSSGIEHYVKSIWAVAGLIVFVTAMQVMRYHLTLENSAPVMLSRHLLNFVRSCYKHPRSCLIPFAFDALLGLAILATAMGDFRRPSIYFFIAIWMISCGRDSTNTNYTPVHVLFSAVMVLFLFNNFQGTKFVAMGKLTNNYVEQNAPFLQLSEQQINAPGKPYKFMVFNQESLQRLKNEGLFLRRSDWDDAMVRLSYSYPLDQSTRKPIFLPNTNLQYIEDFNLMLQAFAELGIGYESSETIGSLSFTNGFPFMLKSPLSRTNFNWFHLGTTFHPDRTDKFVEAFSDADFLVVPARDYDKVDQRIFLNCTFHIWNFKQEKRFVGLKVVGRYLLFASQEAASRLNLNLEKGFVVDEEDVRKKCSVARSRL